jgi:hypothetical protein
LAALAELLDQAQLDALARLRVRLGQRAPLPAPPPRRPVPATCHACGQPVPPAAAVFRPAGVAR